MRSLLSDADALGPSRLLRVAAVATAIAAQFVLSSCGDSTTEPTPVSIQAAFALWAIDKGNSGDASDIEVRLRGPADPSGIAEFRIFLLEAQGAGSFDAAAASTAPASSFVSVPLQTEDVDVGFASTATTTSGQAIQDGGSYAVAILSVPIEGGVPGTVSNTVPVALAQTNIVRTLAGPIPGGSGGMETDMAGNIYAADFGVSLDGPPGTVVYRISPSGDWSIWARGLVGASGNAFDSQGNLLQSNISGASVSKITPDGTASTFATGLAGGPVGIAVTPGDTAFVVNCGQNQIHRIEPDGSQSVWLSSSLFNCPNGITLDDDGNLYVANFSSPNIVKIAPDQSLSVLATVGSGNNGHILFGNGVLYVAARGAHQIYQVSLDGTVKLLAGSGARGLKDGAALDATLSLTNDIALSPDGRILYFNDVGVTTGGSRIIGPVMIRALLLEEAGSGQ